MRKGILIQSAIVLITLYGGASLSQAQSINLWRGNEIKANWNDAYKWKLKHVPTGSESILFREANSVVAIDSTIYLENGIQLYGQELSFEGNGNLNLRSPIPYQNTVYVPASATGYANLTLNENLSINGNIALSAKAFGTSASKGSITLKDRTTVSGSLLIGNNGSGSGKVFVNDKSNYRISGIELNTKAEQGGSAEIYITGGTVEIDTKEDPFAIFLEDPSRKIIIGDFGTLRVTSNWPIARKKKAITEMLKQKRLVADSNCQFVTPIFQNNLILIKAEYTGTPQDLKTLIASINQSRESTSSTSNPTLTMASSGIVNSSKSATESSADTMNPASKNSEQSTTPLAGYVVFFGAFLFMFRPAKAASSAK